MEVLNLYKEVGETPLARIERFKKKHPAYKEVAMTYLGRLDPLAEGVLLIGVEVDDATRQAVMSLPKTYELDVVGGASTDTHDLLGLVVACIDRLEPVKIDQWTLVEYLASQQGVQEQKYPDYSSKPVQGEPLFSLARRGALDPVERPVHQIEIYKLALTKLTEITGRELLLESKRKVDLVHGDFRQEIIQGCWERTLGSLYDVSFPIISLTIEASAGTYMRVIADELGQNLGFPSLAYAIRRIAVGDYDQSKSLRE